MCVAIPSSTQGRAGRGRVRELKRMGIRVYDARSVGRRSRQGGWGGGEEVCPPPPPPLPRGTEEPCGQQGATADAAQRNATDPWSGLHVPSGRGKSTAAPCLGV